MLVVVEGRSQHTDRRMESVLVKKACVDGVSVVQLKEGVVTADPRPPADTAVVVGCHWRAVWNSGPQS